MHEKQREREKEREEKHKFKLGDSTIGWRAFVETREDEAVEEASVFLFLGGIITRD